MTKELIEKYKGKKVKVLCGDFQVDSVVKDIDGDVLVIEDSNGTGLIPLSVIRYIQIKNEVQVVKPKILV